MRPPLKTHWMLAITSRARGTKASLTRARGGVALGSAPAWGMAAGTVKDLHDLLNVVANVGTKFPNEVWWRGQARADWKLVPGVYRRADGERNEYNLVQRFVRMARTRHPKCPPTGELASWLFFMQHYRLPTRLLDWTESPLAATYFAVVEQHEEPAALWALSPYLLNESQSGTRTLLLSGHVPKLFNEAYGGAAQKTETRVAAVHADEVDLRMLVQLSVFTVHGSRQPLEERPDAEKFLLKIEIPASAKPDIHEALVRLGVRESTLFPDLDHLADELRQYTFQT